ncbi:MAG: NUMOD3 domain-containing DNA-binding protein, partial [Candidatus Coproplasma sp.]
ILFDSLTKEQAEEKEIELIAEYNSADRVFGYNIEFGGFANTVSEETKQKLRTINTGKHLSDETKAKLSERFSGINHPNYGLKFNDELRRKLSEAHRGKKQSEETRQKRIASLRGKKRSAETCERMSKAQSKKVAQCDDDGNVIALYPSILEAGQTIGINERNIGAVCLGKRKHAGGFVWRYAE